MNKSITKFHWISISIEILLVGPQALHRSSHTRHSHHDAGSGEGCVMYTLEGTKRSGTAGQQEILRETVDVRHNPQMSNHFVHAICQQI